MRKIVSFSKMSPEAIKAELSALRDGYDDSVLTQDKKDKRNKRITKPEAALKAS